MNQSLKVGETDRTKVHKVEVQTLDCGDHTEVQTH